MPSERDAIDTCAHSATDVSKRRFNRFDRSNLSRVEIVRAVAAVGRSSTAEGLSQLDTIE